MDLTLRKLQDMRENVILRNSLFVLLKNSDNQIEDAEIVRACSAHGESEKYFGSKASKEGLGADRELLISSGLIWLRRAL